MPKRATADSAANVACASTQGGCTRERGVHRSLFCYQAEQTLTGPVVPAEIVCLLNLAQLMKTRVVAIGVCVTDFRWS